MFREISPSIICLGGRFACSGPDECLKNVEHAGRQSYSSYPQILRKLLSFLVLTQSFLKALRSMFLEFLPTSCVSVVAFLPADLMRASRAYRTQATSQTPVSPSLMRIICHFRIVIVFVVTILCLEQQCLLSRIPTTRLLLKAGIELMVFSRGSCPISSWVLSRAYVC